MSSREDSLIERIKSISDDALSRGWKITKEAMASADPQRQGELTQQAEIIYRSPSSEIAREILFGSPLEEILRFLTVEFLKTEINVFDLYRRVGRIDEARGLGEIAFDRSVAVGDTALINRCGDKLGLVISGRAYIYLESNDFERAYESFSRVEEIFSSMKIDGFQGRDAVMVYSNRAANLLSMVDISMSKGLSTKDIDKNLLFAEKYNLESRNFIDDSGLNDEDKSTCMANFYYNLGLICKFKGNFDGAIQEYRNALSISEGGSEYTAQIMILCVTLLDALISTQNPIHYDEIKSNYGLVEKFVSEKGGFGVYNPLINPLIDRIRDWNESH